MLHADSRNLIAKLHAPYIRLIVIVSHAPHTQATEQELRDHWNAVHTRIRPRYQHWNWVLLTDANAALGSTPTQAVGQYAAEEETVAGEVFHTFLLEQSLFAPSTFSDYTQGPSGTWRHPRSGEWQRKDYVCIPQGWQSYLQGAEVDAHLDVSTVKDDHRPVWVQVKLPGESQSPSAIHRKAKYDPAGLRQVLTGPHRGKIFQHTLGDTYEGLSVHAHLEQLCQNIHADIQAWVPKQKRRRIKQHLQDSTWALVLQKREARQSLAQAEKASTEALLLTAFRGWAGKPPQVDRGTRHRQAAAWWLAYRRLGRPTIRA